jgi:hypothetical protein
MAVERLTALGVSPTGAAMILPDFDAAEFAAVDDRPSVAAWADRHGPADARPSPVWARLTAQR